MSSYLQDSATRNRSNSGEDSELAEHERKRPRLSESKSDTDDFPAHKGSNLVTAKSAAASNQDGEGILTPRPPLPPRANEGNINTSSPTSKVTINTRPLSSQSMTKNVSQSGDGLISAVDVADVDPTNATEAGASSLAIPTTSSMSAAADAHETISISSSPSKSPEIEIAEVEDYDQDPTETRWTTRIGGSSAAPRQIQPLHIYRTFPMAGERKPGEARHAILRINKIFTDGRQDDGEIFQRVKNWFTDFLAACDYFTDAIIDEDREFWCRLPSVVEGLLKRDQKAPSPARSQDLIDFFVTYGQITKLMMEYDTRKLQAESESKVLEASRDYVVVSWHYLLPIAWIMSTRVPFYDALRRYHDFDVMMIVNPVADRLMDPAEGDLMRALSTLVSALGAVLPKHPYLHKMFPTIIHALSVLIQLYAAGSDGVPIPQAFAVSQVENVRQGTEEVTLKIDTILQEAITKQYPWLTLETGGDLLNKLNGIMKTIAVEIPRVGQNIIISAGVTFNDADLTDLPKTMPYAWKFMILRKFIKHGRMELRVYGIETMSTDLVAIYFANISGKMGGRDDPLVRYLVRFIQENEMISYIIGVDSHPQLIQRSYNIVGFLCVADTYADSDTDTIWKVVTDSQDPRTVLEVLLVLQQCFNTYELPALHYLCQKLIDLPLSKFDGRMLEFTSNLLHAIRSKSQNVLVSPDEPFAPATRKLCTRLLRDTNSPEFCTSDQAAQIRREILSQLHTFLQPFRNMRDRLAIGQDEEDQLLNGIRADIESHSDNACGAVYIINSILAMTTMTTTGLLHIVEKCGLPRVLVQDLAYMCHNNKSVVRSSLSTALQYESRLACLYSLLRLVPSNFNEGMLEALWSRLLTAEEVAFPIRVQAWGHLTNVMKHCKSRNLAIDRLLEDFLPRLGPRDFSKAVLDFAEQSVVYESDLSDHTAMDISDVVALPGIERIWKIMLEAPAGTVEGEATDFIIEQYLRGGFISKRSKSSISLTHLALIDRVVDLVLGSAARLKSFTSTDTESEEDEGMVIIATEAEIRIEELRFDRSLFFLRRFTEAMRGRAGFSPSSPAHQDSLPEFLGKRGDSKEIWIQIPGNKYISNAMRKASVGSANTGIELSQYLADISGFSHFEVIHGGQKILIQNETATLEDLKIVSGLVLVHKIPCTQEQIPPSTLRSSSPVDEKVMHHFEDLYGLLESDVRLAREVFNFLSISTIREKVSAMIRSMSTPSEELLPPEKPYKLLFCTQALRSCVEVESFSSEPDTDFLIYGVHAITAILPRLTLIGRIDSLSMAISYELIDTLILAFKAKVPTKVSHGYLKDHAEFVRHVLKILQASQSSHGIPSKQLSPDIVVKAPFEALAEACLHDERTWDQLDGNANFQRVVQDILLHDARTDVRQVILDVILGLTGSTGTKIMLKINDPRAPRSRYTSVAIDGFLDRFWNLLLAISPAALRQETHCQEFFDTSLLVMRRVGKSIGIDELQSLFEGWSGALIGHEHQEIVGQTLRDRVIAGITRLLQECSKLLRAKNALPPSYNFVQELMSRFLFPPLSDSGIPNGRLQIPILDAYVREGLYDLALTLCQKPNEIDALFSDLSNDLVPQDFFGPHIAHDRQCLRTEVGYAGLRNLSNTCYLNSLFSQLFMNLQFRELILGVPIHDESRQKLLVELSKVFAYMQNSHEKSIDPSAAVESITTYDGDQIDVTVQMDVDEFFNLLFDRLEGQMFDPAARSFFKSLYGGQTMHQIKSKECNHISERPEPFSALQVEIKGKSRLEDSLKAYVEGEVLQGENKYSCTSCGRHVDAVKRACLKDVPDNLIFNLKRFDYDIMTGMRCKLNDQFQFPDTIDIAPYTLEQLSHPGNSVASDLFELTGIIVHSGTADSGHYYSFVRQRPSVKDKQYSWIQFNDHDVTPFDAALIQDNCFGGFDTSCYNMAKFYNAYMLFYQRASSIQKTEKQYDQHDLVNPVRLPLAIDMDYHIAQQNELFLRSYCAQDPSHARFVRQILERLYASNQEQCSSDHCIEPRALKMALDYVQQVSSRWKGQPEMEATVKLINAFGQRCFNCASVILDWLQGGGVLLNAIVKSPYQATRKAFGSIFRTSLRSIHAALDDQGDSAQVQQYHNQLQECLEGLAKGWDLVCRFPRPWPEYFGILHDIVLLGDEEARLVIDTEFLERCLEIIYLHNNDNVEFRIERRLRVRYAQYLNARDKNRPFNHGILLAFFAAMLLAVDLHQLPDGEYRMQKCDSAKVALAPTERSLLGIDRLPHKLEWLRRLIAGRHAPQVADHIVAYLARDRYLAGAVGACLINGLDAKSMSTAVSFLQPSLAFCQHCCSENQVIDLIQPALEGISTIGMEYGRDYLNFVRSLTIVGNETIGLEPGFLKETLLSQIQHWAPVCLVSIDELQHDVRSDALNLVKQILLDPLDQAQNENPRLFHSLGLAAQDLATVAAKYAQETFLNQNSKDDCTLQPGQANQLIQVLGKCLDFFSLDKATDEERVAEIQEIMHQLGQKAEQAVDTLSAAEWQESSEMEATSDADFDELTSP